MLSRWQPCGGLSYGRGCKGWHQHSVVAEQASTGMCVVLPTGLVALTLPRRSTSSLCSFRRTASAAAAEFYRHKMRQAYSVLMTACALQV